MHRTFYFSQNPSSRISWQDSIQAAQASLQRPGSFQQRIPLVETALSNMQAIAGLSTHWNHTSTSALWMKSFALLETLYKKAPRPDAVPNEVPMKALKVWHTVETAKANPLWTTALRAMQVAFRDVKPGSSTESRALLEIGIQLDLKNSNVIPKQTATKLKQISERQGSTQNCNIPFCGSVEDLQEERDVLKNHIMSPGSPIHASHESILRLLLIENSLILQAKLRQSGCIASSWMETLGFIEGGLSQKRSMSENRRIKELENKAFVYILQHVPSSIGSMFAEKYFLRESTEVLKIDRKIIHKPILDSHRIATFAALCTVSAAGKFAVLFKLLDAVHPSPLKREIATVLFTGMDMIDGQPSTYNFAENSHRIALFFKLCAKHCIGSPKSGESKDTIMRALRSLHAGVSAFLCVKCPSTLRLGMLFHSSVRVPSSIVPSKSTEKSATPLQLDPIVGAPCDSRGEFVERSLNRLLTKSIGGYLASSLDADKIDIQLHQDNPVPQYSRNAMDYQDSSSLPETVVIFSRSEAITPRRRKKHRSALALLCDTLRLNPSGVKHSKIMQTLAHLRGGSVLDQTTNRSIVVQNHDFWKSMLKVWPFLRQDHPDIRAELVTALKFKLILSEGRSLRRSLSREPSCNADSHEKSELTWVKAIALVKPADLESANLAPLVIQLAMLHPLRWAYALHIYSACASRRLISEENPMPHVYISWFVRALSIAPKASVCIQRPLPTPLHRLFQVGHVSKKQFYDRHVSSLNVHSCALQKPKPQWELHHATSADSYIDTLRCAFFGDTQWPNTKLCSSWELTLGLLQVQPRLAIHSKEIAKFVLFALVECCASSRLQISEHSASAVPIIIEEGLKEIAFQASSREKAEYCCNLVASLHTKISFNGKQLTSETNSSAFPASLSPELLKTVLFTIVEMVNEVFPKLDCAYLRKHRSEQAVYTLAMRRRLTISGDGQSSRTPRTFLLAESLSTALCGIPCALNRALVALLDASQKICMSMLSSIDVGVDALVAQASLSPIVKKMHFLETIKNQCTDLQKSKKEKSATTPKTPNHFPTHANIVSECPELFIEHQRQLIRESNASSSRALYHCDDILVASCPPRVSLIDFAADFLSDIKSLSDYHSSVEWTLMHCTHLAQLESDSTEGKIQTISGQSLMIFRAVQGGLCKRTPLALELARTCAQPKPASYTIPAFVQPTRYRYIAFAHKLHAMGDTENDFLEYEIDARTNHILAKEPISLCGSERSNKWITFLRNAYPFDSVLIRVIGSADNLNPSQTESSAHSDVENSMNEPSHTYAMLEVLTRESLTDNQMKVIIEAIGYSITFPEDDISEKDARKENTQRECDSFAMVELRYGDMICETTLPDDMANHSLIYCSATDPIGDRLVLEALPGK